MKKTEFKRNKLRKRILYLTYNATRVDRAPGINSHRRARAIEASGCVVRLFSVRRDRALSDFFRLVTWAHAYDVLYIRIDGSNTLDFFCLLRVFNPGLKVVWEVHAFADEWLYSDFSGRMAMRVLVANTLRYMLSALVDTYVFTSKTIERYSRRKLIKRNYKIIHNFAEVVELNTKQLHKKRRAHTLSVFWGGNPSHRWHLLNLIEDVARCIYKKDKSITFTIVGSDHWHTFSWSKNIQFIDDVSHSKMMDLIGASDVCLALYKKSSRLPMYFSSLKVLDYLSAGKTVVATRNEVLGEFLQDGKNGILVENTVEAVVEKILMLKQDQALRVHLEKEAMLLIKKRFNVNNASTKYKELFI